jgi:hypothetical protein
MNEKREKLNTPLDSRFAATTIEKETDRLSFAEIPVVAESVEREITPRSLEEVELPITRFDVETKPAPLKLSAGERAGYALRGAGWTLATGVTFVANGVVLFLDGGLLNILFTTTGYLAYKQFKSAITGTAHSCLKFVCTLETVKKKAGSVFTSVKDFVIGKRPSNLDCVGCTA